MFDSHDFTKKIHDLAGRIPPRDFALLTGTSFTGFLLERLGQATVIIINREGNILYVSERAEKLLDISGADLVGKEYFKHIIEYDDAGKEIPNRKRLAWEALHTANYKRVTPFFCYYGPPEKRLHIAMSATVIHDGGEVAGAVLLIREVKRVLNVDEMKSLFVSFAAHQLKTPSSIVKGFLELMIREGHNSYSKTQWENLQSAFEANESLIRLSKALLNLTKLEGGLIEPKLSVINPGEVITDKISSQKLLANLKNIQPQLRVLGQNQDFETDEMIFSELFDILFSNAVKFSPNSSTIYIIITFSAKGLTVTVQDQGPGIPPEQIEKLFSTTFKSDPASQGHGLGLAMAKKYLALLGGEISASSTVGQGTTFSFFIPTPLN